MNRLLQPPQKNPFAPSREGKRFGLTPKPVGFKNRVLLLGSTPGPIQEEFDQNGPLLQARRGEVPSGLRGARAHGEGHPPGQSRGTPEAL